jgi:hypothetical protein
MKKTILTLLLFTIASSVFCQDKVQQAIDKINDRFERPVSKPQIYLLGTFHFAGEQVD